MRDIEELPMQTVSAKSVNVFVTLELPLNQLMLVHTNAQQTKLTTVLSKNNTYVNIDTRIIVNLHYLQDMAVGIRRGLKERDKTVTN